MSDIGDFDEDTDFESDEGESVTQSSESPESDKIRFMYESSSDELERVEPRLDCVPSNIVELICSWSGLKEIIALRLTCKALDRAIADRPKIWPSLVQAYRRSPSNTLLIGPYPVVMPNIYHLIGFQEDLLRCAFILRNKWHNPAFQARQILFVPGAMGRFFLTVSRASVVLWTLDPDGVPHCCRSIVVTRADEMIVQALVSRPYNNLVAYLAVQITQQHTHRLRTEIYQLHLSRPGILYDSGFGLVAIHETEGALVAFVDYVLAYATNDAGQTILLCCWVSKRATRLAPPVSEHEIRWQHSSCRGVKFGTDIIVVVRDSAAEIYPRNEFAIVNHNFPINEFRGRVVRGDLEMLPVTYATDTALFPSSFLEHTSIHIHDPQSVSYGSEDLTHSVRVISLVGVARSTAPLTDPSIPYFVVAAQLYRWTTSRYYGSSQTSPSHTAPPSPSHTTPSPTHTHAQAPPRNTPSPAHSNSVSSPGIPTTEKYKFIFHIHALQHQHPHFSYGPAIAGPNGRAVMLATMINMSNGTNQPKQYILKYRHPTSRELKRFLNERIHPTMPPGALRSSPGQPSSNTPHPTGIPQPQPQPPPPQPGHVQLPAPPSHPLLNQHPTPHQDPYYGALTPLTRPLPVLDILRGMSPLWHTQGMLGYEMIAWDEGAGTILVASRMGEVVVLECAKPASDPVGASSWHRN